MADDRRTPGVEPGQPDGDGTKRATASTDPGAAAETPYEGEGRIGTDLANVSWRFRVLWLGDGER